MEKKVLVETSARHVHVTREALDILFGEGYELTVRSVRLSAGAGFVVAFAGSIIAMPGLPKAPAALNIDVDDNGQIVGLF